MNQYSIMGACLETNIPFPELRLVSGDTPKWTFETVARLEPEIDAVELGAELIYGDVHARLYRHAHGHRIVVDDTGVFDLSPDHRHVRWQERAESWPDFVRAHLMGRVLATSLYLDGWLPLHGSAVAFGDEVITFLAPKGYGKSSLALALTRVGGRLVTDDLLPVELSSPPRAWPGVHAVRANPDALARIGLPDGPRTREGKVTVNALPAEQLAHGPATLGAVYILQPVIADAAIPVPVRIPLPETTALLTIVANVKVAQMLGASAAPALLDRAASLARSVSAFTLVMPRDLDGLSSAAREIASWHGAGGSQPSTVPSPG